MAWKRCLAALVLSAAGAGGAAAGQVEVLHWWTSGGESRSVEELKRLLATQGHTWRDFAVVGGGGDSAMAVLRSRVLAGNPPAAAQVKGPAIQDLNKGSIPVGSGVRMDRFDLCAQESAAYFAATAMISTLVPSIAHLMAQPAPIETAMREVVASYWNNDRMTADEAMARQIQATKARAAKMAARP